MENTTPLDFAFKLLFELFCAEFGVMIIWIIASFLLGTYNYTSKHKTNFSKENLSYFHPAYWFSTCFGLGKIPFISGTWGSLFAINMIIIIAIMPRMGVIEQNTIFWLLAFATLLSSIAGIKSSDIYSKRTLASNITGKSIARDLKIIVGIMILFVGSFSIISSLNADTYEKLFREAKAKSIEFDVSIKTSDLSIFDSTILPFYGYLYQNIYFWGLLFITIFFCILRIKNSNKYAKKMDKADPSAVIIDEVAGQLITICIAVIAIAILYLYDYDSFRPLIFLFPFYILICFLLFRLFDITKPLIIGKLDKNLKGGIGIMMDDIVAGVFAGILFVSLFLTMHFTGGFFWFFSLLLPDWIGTPPPVGEIK